MIHHTPQHRLLALERVFTEIAHTRMRGVPVQNPAVHIQAFGFAPDPDDADMLLGVRVTICWRSEKKPDEPWAMSLLSSSVHMSTTLARSRFVRCFRRCLSLPAMRRQPILRTTFSICSAHP